MRTEKSAKGHKSRPLTTATLKDLALSYVSRFATTSGKLEAYLRRKLRERGWAGDGEPDPAAIAARFAELGYIDDEAWARARADGLLRRGYGARRVAQTLGAAGIDPDLRNSVRPGEGESRRAALALARRRGFGPFGGESPDRERREKQLAAMVRAGHGFDVARAVVDAPNETAAEEWAADVEES